MAEWFYASQGQQAGPVDQATLQQMIGSGQVQPGDLVWRDGMASWQPASTVPELSAHGIAGQAAPHASAMGYQQPAAYPQPGYSAQPLGYHGSTPGLGPSSKGMAIGSLVCSCIALLCVGFITGPVGVILGFVALNSMKKNNNPEGRGLAIAGVIVGICTTILGVLGLIFMIAARSMSPR
jgi:hypothetical protein